MCVILHISYHCWLDIILKKMCCEWFMQKHLKWGNWIQSKIYCSTGCDHENIMFTNARIPLRLLIIVHPYTHTNHYITQLRWLDPYFFCKNISLMFSYNEDKKMVCFQAFFFRINHLEIGSKFSSPLSKAYMGTQYRYSNPVRPYVSLESIAHTPPTGVNWWIVKFNLQLSSDGEHICGKHLKGTTKRWHYDDYCGVHCGFNPDCKTSTAHHVVQNGYSE